MKKVFVTNLDADSQKVQWYPIGRDPGNQAFFDIPPSMVKQGLVYSNFSLATHEQRKKIYELLSAKDFVDCVKIDSYGKDTGYPMSNEAYLNELNSHAFAVCPRGNGVDTFRFWDSLHLGVVPIVVREAHFQKDLQYLPVLFLDEVDQFGDLTRGFLEKRHQEMMNTEYDFSMLRASYWQDQLRHPRDAVPM